MANNKVLKRRVVVTGLGAITPIGNSVAEFWDGIRKGKVGIGEITKFDTTDYKVKLAAEVKDFVPGDHMDKKAARRMEAFSQYAVAAAREAYEDSGLEIEKEDPFRAGVMIGSGIGSLQVAEQSYEKILTKGPARVNPLMVPLMISNMAAGNVSIQLGFRGKCSNVVTACATGTNCIGDAFRTIQYGDADMMLAGGTEGCVCPLGIAGFTALTALSASTDPLRASIPFDKDRDGFVLGEGAGRAGACKSAWGKNLRRSDRLRMYRGCLSYYFSGRRRKRCSEGNGACHGRGPDYTGTGRLHQCPWNKYPSQ